MAGKLTEPQRVELAKRAHLGKETQAAIAKSLGVSLGAVQHHKATRTASGAKRKAQPKRHRRAARPAPRPAAAAKSVALREALNELGVHERQIVASEKARARVAAEIKRLANGL